MTSMTFISSILKSYNLRRYGRSVAIFMGKNIIKQRVADAANIPKDVICGVPLIRMIGREEFYIENYRGILEYTDSQIRIQTKIAQIQLFGKKLEIVYYTNDEMKVVGHIDKLEYHQGG